VPWSPLLIQSWVAAGTIDQLLASHDVQGEIDLLCIDIDSVDLWVWDALTVVRPRVVLVEYSHHWGPHRSVAVPPDVADEHPELLSPSYCSASLPAYINVGRAKGYRLVAVSDRRFNALFVRDDIADGVLEELTAEEAFANPPMPEGRTTWSDAGLPGEWVEVPPR
jgi:hypothetical protein